MWYCIGCEHCRESYLQMKAIANGMGIHAADKSLWSDTGYVRRLLSEQGARTSSQELPFTTWDDLPDLALLSINHYEEEGKEYWHWVVFKRVENQAYVLDSASYLPANIRQDFESMKPKWFIEVEITGRQV